MTEDLEHRAEPITRGLEVVIPWIVFLFLLAFSYAYFFKVPYAGFYFQDGVIREVSSPHSSLKVGDRLIEFGDLEIGQFLENPTTPLIHDLQPGKTISILVERQGRLQEVNWALPGPTLDGIANRLLSTWWLSYVFWLAGTAALLFLRPKDTRWRLLTAFYYLTALWLVVGTGLSEWHVWYGGILVRSLIWINLPVYVHLHWEFPRLLRPISPLLLVLLYGAGFFLAVYEWFQILPAGLFYSGIVGTVMFVVVLLGYRWNVQKEDRQDLSLFASAFLLIMVPSFAVALATALGTVIPSYVRVGAMLILPGLPGAYFLIAFRQQFRTLESRIKPVTRYYLGILCIATVSVFIFSILHYQGTIKQNPSLASFIQIWITVIGIFIGLAPYFLLPALVGESANLGHHPGQLEIRANHLFAAFMFIMILGGSLTLGIILLGCLFKLPGEGIFLALFAAVVSGLATAAGIKPFQRLINRILWNIEPDPEDMMRYFADRITTSLDHESLGNLLKDDLLASLMVRQSALLELKNKNIQPFMTIGLEPEQYQAEEQIPVLTAHSGKYLPSGNTPSSPLDWVRLVIPLKLAGELTGLWLFGARDPDDFYAPDEIRLLETLAGPTAVALANIKQATLLHVLYNSSIDRQEEERKELSRLLHDQVLGKLADIALNESNLDSDRFREHCSEIADRIRGLIATLRPAMLAYGLWPALDEFVDELTDRLPMDCQLRYEIPRYDCRYDPKVEEHCYRIVQQACENAVQHAQASTIRISGTLSESQIILEICDDGIGLPFRQHDLHNLVANRHFGLAGIHERAQLLNADLRLESSPGRGTHVRLTVITDQSQKAAKKP